LVKLSNLTKKLSNQLKGPARLSSPKSVGSLGLMLRKKKYESTYKTMLFIGLLMLFNYRSRSLVLDEG